MRAVELIGGPLDGLVLSAAAVNQAVVLPLGAMEIDSETVSWTVATRESEKIGWSARYFFDSTERAKFVKVEK